MTIYLVLLRWYRR